MGREGKPVQLQEKGIKAAVRALAKWKEGSLAVVAISIVILAAVSFRYFSFLDAQLYESRKSHMVAFADKVSGVVDMMVEYAWQQVSVCRSVIESGGVGSERRLREVLRSTEELIDVKHTLMLAVDENARYYASDGTVGSWEQADLLAGKASRKRQMVSEIPHMEGKLYLVFMERLSKPLDAGAGNAPVTHIAVAVDMEEVREKIAIEGFGDQCYMYLVNREGRRFYKHTYGKSFIEGYNVLNAVSELDIVHGGTYDKFVRNLEYGNNTAVEFAYANRDGSKENWYLANAALASEQWQVLLFLPASELGADTVALMNRTWRFFAAASVAFMVMFAVTILFSMAARSDRRLVKEKDEANRRLQISEAEARNANQAKSDFLAHMSHDIRTPINGIMGMTEIALKHMDEKERLLDCLNKINGSSRHLLGLINDVLDMSRIESGKTKANHESFDLRSCMENCVSIISGQLVVRDIELVREFDDFRHPMLIGDELHLRQVFINILGNSVKFTPDGGKIFFRAKETESADGKAFFRFELEDTGMGMKAEFIPHLFDPFSQEDGGARSTYKGTGLGMAITKRFLDLMGATIAVESQVNVGTKFVIEIGIDIDENADGAAAGAGEHFDITGMHILLAEDIDLNLEIARSLLEERGAIVTAAMDGRAAVDAFVNHPHDTFDAVLMDIMMPVMDGITATKTIRSLERADAQTIPIIAMTANAYDDDIRRTREAGMNAHLSKPIDLDLVLKTLAHFYHKQNKAQKESALAGLKVLLADDVALNREIAEEMLGAVGVEVVAVPDGWEAVEAFKNNMSGTFDAILMDVHMPVMDGLTATRVIRALNRQDAGTISIFAMTADVYEEDIREARDAGMDGNLAKPLDMGQIMGVLGGVRNRAESAGRR